MASKLGKSDRPIAAEPWHAETEIELLDRPGVCFISLLTDECGCLLLAKGIIPDYLKRQAQKALEWSATEERGIAQRLINAERHRAHDTTSADTRGSTSDGMMPQADTSRQGVLNV